MGFEVLLEKTAAAAAKVNPAKDGDFMQDGLLHCGQCGAPKQIRIEAFDPPRVVNCLCQCQLEARRREEEARREWERREKLKKLRTQAFDSPLLRESTFRCDDDPQSEIGRICRRYVEHFDEISPKGLLLFGSVGTGKSFYAACIANALLDRGIPCRMTTFASLDKERDELDGYRVVILDDFGAQRDTEYKREVVWSVIDGLYRRQTTLLCTTNLTAQELKKPADLHQKRIFSRLYEMCIFQEVQGKDRRRERMIAENARFKALLTS